MAQMGRHGRVISGRGHGVTGPLGFPSWRTALSVLCFASDEVLQSSRYLERFVYIALSPRIAAIATSGRNRVEVTSAKGSFYCSALQRATGQAERCRHLPDPVKSYSMAAERFNT